MYHVISLNALPSSYAKGLTLLSHFLATYGSQFVNMEKFVGVCEVLFLFFNFLWPGVFAFDGGDAAALVLGTVLGVLGVCACLGYYARRRAGV